MRSPNLFNENGILNKPCGTCGCQITKSNAVYNGNSVRAFCKSCVKKHNRDYWRNNPHEARENHLSRVYGITQQEFNDLLAKQNGVCAICNGINANGRELSIDHDHKTGKNRALLCHNCNVILGYARENPEILEKCINYLIKHTDFEKEFSFQHE